MNSTIQTSTQSSGRTLSPATPLSAYLELQDSVLDHFGVNAESIFVMTAQPKMRVHMLRAGHGDPVIVFHGGDGEGWNWAPLIAELQGGYAIYSVDRPGFGLSDMFEYASVNLRQHASDFVVSLIDALGLEKANVVGGSMGGFFALCGALDHPDRVSNVALVGMPVGFFNVAPDSLIELCSLPGRAEEFMDSVGNLDGQRWQYREMFHVDPATVPDVYFRARVAGVNLPGVKQTWATMLRRLCGPDGFRPDAYLGDDLPNLSMPVLTIWGEHDMVPKEAGQAVASRIPKGQFACLPDAGHFPFLEAPAETARLIREFLNE